MQDFFESMNAARSNATENQVQKYLSISPLLIKIESFVAGSSSGRSRTLQPYYKYWEKRIFTALCMMVINNIRLLEKYVAKPKKLKGDVKHQAQQMMPLFKLSAILSAPEIVTMPALPELYKLMMKFTRSIVDSTKQFLRWQNGSCVITQPQKVLDSDEPVVYSFYNDVVGHQLIGNSIQQLHGHITHGFNNVGRWLESWKKYKPLWKVDKTVTLEKFVAKKPNLIMYDEKLGFYDKLAADVPLNSQYKDLGFIRVISTPLQKAIHQEAKEWLISIGESRFANPYVFCRTSRLICFICPR
jgi:dynein heavy chain, axonemal